MNLVVFFASAPAPRSAPRVSLVTRMVRSMQHVITPFYPRISSQKDSKEGLYFPCENIDV